MEQYLEPCGCIIPPYDRRAMHGQDCGYLASLSKAKALALSRECECVDPEWCWKQNEGVGLMDRAKVREGQARVLKVCGVDKRIWVEHLVDGSPDPLMLCLFRRHTLPSPHFGVNNFDTMLEYADFLKSANRAVRIEINWKNRWSLHLGVLNRKGDADGLGRRSGGA